MSRRITGNGRFGPSLDWERSPIVGAAAADRAHRQRVRQIMKVALAMAIFWAGVAFALLWRR